MTGRLDAARPRAPTSACGWTCVAALARLPHDQREPLLLVSVEQFSYAEAAEVLRVPIGTVMSRVSAARASLLRALLDGRPLQPSGAQCARADLRRVI